jgi:putative tryptophan/tyrosine transport system ATP-binding protein
MSTESPPLCVIDNIGLHFPLADRPILQNINYKIHPGDRIILLGSNGSGKSSLLKLLNRTYQPGSGEILLDGRKISAIPLKEFTQRVVTVTQDLRDSLFFNLTVLENCLLWETRFQTISFKISKNKERAFYKNYLAQFHQQLSKKLDVVIAALSGGERQSLVLALCLKHPPELLLLDEHTSALDPKIAANLINYTEKLLEEKSITCVLATHNLEIALKYGNRLLALSEGQIKLTADGIEKSHLTQEALLERCYL